MSSIDDAERAKFSQDYSYWWDPNGPLASLHQFNSARVSFLSNHFKGTLSNRRVLDIGCGGGILSFSVARLGAHVTGIDISRKTIAAAQQQKASGVYGGGSVEFHCTTLEDWVSSHQAPNDRFDLVMLSEVIEHVKDYKAFLSAASRCVRLPGKGANGDCGGALFLTTINRNFFSRLVMIDAAEKLTGILPRGTHSYEKFVRPAEVEGALRGEKMQIVERCGFVPVPHVFPRPRLSFAVSSTLTAVNYGVIARWVAR